MRLKLTMFGALAISACSNSVAPAPAAQAPSPAPSTTAPATQATARSRIDPGVFTPYTRSEFPKTYAKFGAAMGRAQTLREQAAFKALASGRCDRVATSELSDHGTAGDLVAFVDCENLERFYISESDLQLAAPALAQSERTIDRQTAIKRCSAAAKTLVTYPSLFDAHTWSGSSFSADKTTGNAQVILDFNATNGFGAALPYRARCTFTPGAAGPEIEVSPR